VVAYAKETRVTVSKERKEVSHPVHMVDFLDADGKPCDVRTAARLRRVNRFTVETTYTVDNKTSGEVPLMFIDHKAADKSFKLVVGSELLDPRFPSPVVYRLNTSLPASAKRSFSLVESREDYATTAITSLSKEEITRLLRAGLITAETAAGIEAVVARVAAIRKAEETLDGVRKRVGRLDATKATVDVAGILHAIEELDSLVMRHLPA